MEKYQNIVKNVLLNGTHERNRTDEDTIATFGYNYQIDMSEGYPLLTTKKMDNYRWNSLLYELEWYLSGEHHVRNLTEHTSIWDAWADDELNLPSAYGRFWRRYPVPENSQLEGEAWFAEDSDYTTREDNGSLVFDQVKFVVDALNDDNPYRGSESRRLIINAWHPANAQASSLPPCHFTFLFNVQNDKLNLHLTQRSADVALGVPFNIAAYTLLGNIVANQTNYELGTFNHTLVDAHIYCGKGERSEWYSDNLDELQTRVENADKRSDYSEIRRWILDNAPEEEDTSPKEHKYGYDHIPGLLEQLSRKPLDRPKIKISDDATVNNLTYDDIELVDYESYDGLSFGVAE